MLPSPAARRRIRRRAGLSLRDVARLVGVSVAAASRWETGEMSPNREHSLVYGDLLRRLREEVLTR
jgi:DNA-binding transcriptional regulator YiaG